ncbi:MAG: hypothetical protein DYH02_04640 [Candidatus Omnitrophica bacterium COP1]|nr:hypothetical protein [Candidatus Omnitrophica bacterium COP1]
MARRFVHPVDRWRVVVHLVAHLVAWRLPVDPGAEFWQLPVAVWFPSFPGPAAWLVASWIVPVALSAVSSDASAVLPAEWAWAAALAVAAA